MSIVNKELRFDGGLDSRLAVVKTWQAQWMGLECVSSSFRVIETVKSIACDADFDFDFDHYPALAVAVPWTSVVRVE